MFTAVAEPWWNCLYSIQSSLSLISWSLNEFIFNLSFDLFFFFSSKGSLSFLQLSSLFYLYNPPSHIERVVHKKIVEGSGCKKQKKTKKQIRLVLSRGATHLCDFARKVIIDKRASVVNVRRWLRADTWVSCSSRRPSTIENTSYFILFS